MRFGIDNAGVATKAASSMLQCGAKLFEGEDYAGAVALPAGVVEQSKKRTAPKFGKMKVASLSTHRHCDQQPV